MSDTKTSIKQLSMFRLDSWINGICLFDFFLIFFSISQGNLGQHSLNALPLTPQIRKRELRSKAKNYTCSIFLVDIGR